MRRIILTLLLIVPFLAFGQYDDEENQFFSTTRGIANVLDVGKVQAPISKTIEIKNPGQTIATIVGFKVDEGVSVAILKSKMPPNSKGKISISIDPNNLNQKGDFNKKIIVIIRENLSDGTTITREVPYMIKGTY